MLHQSYCFGFIGLGLIGGSILRALKKQYPDCTCVAYSRSFAPLQAAREDGILDRVTNSINADSFGQCDYIFLCTPVEYISVYLETLAPFIRTECTITDVGSVKGCVHETAARLRLEENFIGGHPMAGSEKTGYANSSAELLKNCCYLVTPTARTSPERLEDYTSLIRKMGAIPVVTDCSIHDYSVAGVSHLPHLIAASLVNLVHDHDNAEQLMKQMAAGGFKDITRIASSSPEMWEQICMTNTNAIIALLNDYIASLQDIRDNLEQHKQGYIYDLFERSKRYRDSIGNAPADRQQS